MYDLNDTIVAVSSAVGGPRSIVRITGPQTFATCKRVFEPGPDWQLCDLPSAIRSRGIVCGTVRIDDRLAVDARLYVFVAPHSYTGEPLVEIHIGAGAAVVEALVQTLLAGPLRLAGPGEFTARAYLNGKLDLVQAEAVNEVVSSSNRLQLDAAERLLGGRLTAAIRTIRAAMLDLLSVIEAGLDFSTEDVEIISSEQAVRRLTQVRNDLQDLLAGSIRCESLLDAPAIGIAGAPNAGKSSLLNALLGHERSIVSERPKTTRDVLSGLLVTDRFQCVLFDCAGLIVAPDNVLDRLAQQAAIEALRGSMAVICCVDSAKSDWSEDVTVHALIEPHTAIYAATKADLLSADELRHRLQQLAATFGVAFVPVSMKTGHGLQDLLAAIAEATIGNSQPAVPTVALTARHKQAVTEAIETICRAICDMEAGNDELAVTMIRAAYQAISEVEHEHVDEQVLDRIFSRFCIGK